MAVSSGAENIEGMAEPRGLGLDYWLQWQVLVCGLTFILPALISIVLIRRTPRPQLGAGPRQTLKSSNLWLPCWINLHPRWLLFYRAFAFLSMAFLLLQIVLSFGTFVFFFYTQWTFLLVTLYFALGTIISAQACFTNSTKLFSLSGETAKFVEEDLHEKHDTESSKFKEARDFTGDSRQLLIEKPAGFWEILMHNMYQTCAGAVMLTDIVFWCLLLPFMSNEQFKLTLLIGSMHSVNAVFLILDSAMNSIPFSWFGIVYFVLWSCSYVVFQWALHACCLTWWPYPFLELSTPWAPMWYFALALVHVPCYGLYMLLVWARDSILSRMFPNAFTRLY